ncbi:MAG: glycosyltransferase family 4 protein [Woeseiaceae bacterium]|nr:glycosyltransferase family 4 protein [Woeseiaceae bacterium]
MKVLYLHQYFNGPTEPGSTRSYEFAKRWVGEGHEVHVITTDRSTGSSEKKWRCEDIEGIRVHRINVAYDNSMGFIGRIRAFAKFAVVAGSRAASVGGDVVFATSTPLTIAIPGIRCARVLDVPFVFEVRDLWPEVPIAMGVLQNPVLKFLALRLERYAYAHAASVVALSPGMRDAIVAAGVDRRRVHTIPNACDIDLFSSGDASRFFRIHPELKDRKLVVYAGTIGKVNGVDYMVRVAKEMSRIDDAVTFLVVGQGNQGPELEQQAVDAEVLGNNFYIYPPAPKETMPDLLAACELATSFVIDNRSLWNNSANKFFDAIAAGRPVAINHQGWLAEIIEEHDIGLVLPANDAKRAAIGIAELIGDRERMSQMRRKALDTARIMFDRDKLSSQLADVLESAAVDRS